MKNVGPYTPAELKNTMNSYAEEMVTDELVQRILEPIFKMIKEGKFDITPQRSLDVALSLKREFLSMKRGMSSKSRVL